MFAFIIADWPHTLSALRSQQRGCVGSLIINTGIGMHFKKLFLQFWQSRELFHCSSCTSRQLNVLVSISFCIFSLKTKVHSSSLRQTPRAAGELLLLCHLCDCGVTCLRSLCPGYSQIWSADSLRLKIILPWSRDIHISGSKANLFHPFQSFGLGGCSVSFWLAYKLSYLKSWDDFSRLRPTESKSLNC